MNLKKDKVLHLQECEVFLTIDCNMAPYNRIKNVSFFQEVLAHTFNPSTLAAETD